MSEYPTRRFTFAKLFLGIVFIGLIIALSVIGYLYYQSRQELKYLSSPEGQEALSKKEVDQTLDQLRKLVILPDEEPVIATIIDSALLATQSAFYKGAQDGDKLIVFPQAERAFIYSPSRNILVNAGPLVVQGEQEAEAASTGTVRTASSSSSLE